MKQTSVMKPKIICAALAMTLSASFNKSQGESLERSADQSALSEDSSISSDKTSSKISSTPVSKFRPQTRNPLKWPFSSYSIWNMPIGSGAIYKPANMPPIPSGDPWAPMPQIDDEIIVLRPKAPSTAVYYSDAAWSGRNRCAATGSFLVKVPIPSSYLVPHDNGNASAAFLAADGRTIIQMQPFTRCTIGGPATSLVKFNAVDIYGDGHTGSHGGSGLSAIGGSIRIGELRPGQQGPRHALKVAVDSREVLYPCRVRKECYRWPAVTADSQAVGYYGSKTTSPNPAMKMGSLLAIPASTNLAHLGLETEPGKQLGWTLQNYGAYIVDSAGGPSFYLNAENGPDGSMRMQFQADWGYPLQQRVRDNTPWVRDLQRLVKALYVVDNNSAASIGGGGTPRQPLAPPLR